MGAHPGRLRPPQKLQVLGSRSLTLNSQASPERQEPKICDSLQGQVHPLLLSCRSASVCACMHMHTHAHTRAHMHTRTHTCTHLEKHTTSLSSRRTPSTKRRFDLLSDQSDYPQDAGSGGSGGSGPGCGLEPGRFCFYHLLNTREGFIAKGREFKTSSTQDLA